MGTWPVIKPSAAGAYDEPKRFGCSPGPGRHGAHAHFGAQGIPVTPTKMPDRDLCVAGRVVRIAGPRQPRKGAMATPQRFYGWGQRVGPGIIRPRGGLGSGSSTTTSTTTFGAALPGPRAARGKTETKQPQSGARVPSPALPRATRWKRARMERARQGRRGGGARLGSGTTLVARHPTWLVASQGSAAGPARRANK